MCERDELIPCPLCGGQADYVELYSSCRVSYVKCTICGCQTKPIRWPATGEVDMFKYQQKMRARMRKLWNKRKERKQRKISIKNTKGAHLAKPQINLARWMNRYVDCRGYDKCPAGKFCEGVQQGRSCTKIWMLYLNSVHK